MSTSAPLLPGGEVSAKPLAAGGGDSGRLATLLRVTKSVQMSGPDIAVVFQRLLDGLCEILEAEHGALFFRVDIAGNGSNHNLFTHGLTPEQSAPLFKSVTHGQNLHLVGNEVSRDPVVFGLPADRFNASAFLGASISLGNETVGGIFVFDRGDGEGFTHDDEPLLEMFASQAAIVVRSKLVAAEREEERKVIEALSLEQARLLDSAERQRRKLETLVEASPIGVFVVDALGDVVLVNREAQRLTGTPPNSVQSAQWYEEALTYRRPDGSAYAHEDLPLQRALDRGENVRAEEVIFELRDGLSIPTLVSAMPLYAPDGQIDGAIAVIQDTTPLEEIEKLRNEFLGIIGHELKTPLTAIKGSAATALWSRKPLEPQDALELFQIIDEQADHLRELVDNILDMTRIEAGVLSVTLKPTDIGQLLKEASTTFARTAASQEVVIDCPDDLPQVNIDHRRISQVLANLLSNAAKFSPGTAPIAVSVERRDSFLTVHVRDQGRGIAADKLPLLFRKFSRVHEETVPKLSGTGLGLAICKGIVETHGGHIWAESLGPEKGASFSFTLPIVEQTDLAAPDAGQSRQSNQRTRILVADSDPQMLHLLQTALSKAGYEVKATGSRGEVVGLIETGQPDLVLIGINLPEGSGLDLLKRLRAVSGVPVIFIGNSGDSDALVSALNMGVDDYLLKPFAPAELLARVGATFRRRLQPDKVEAKPPFVLCDLKINFAERRVTISDKPVGLSATEYKLLYELADHAGIVLTQNQILSRVWGPEYSGAAHLVRSFIRNLRRKLGDDARFPRYIMTETGIGYRIPKP